jgi:hypothetical protein
VVYGALRICGAYNAANIPRAEQVTDAIDALDMMLKSWAMDGFLWLRKFIYVTLVAAQNSYDIGAASTDGIHSDVAATVDFLQRPIRVFYPTRYLTDGTETPLGEPLSRSDWSALPNKTTTGSVVSVYYDPQIAMGKLYVWPTPATGVTDKIKLTVERMLEDVGDDDSTYDLPPEALRMLKFNLALEIAPEYSVPPKQLIFIEKYANALKVKLEGFQRDNTSTFFQPDYGGR